MEFGEQDELLRVYGWSLCSPQKSGVQHSSFCFDAAVVSSLLRCMPAVRYASLMSQHRFDQA